MRPSYRTLAVGIALFACSQPAGLPPVADRCLVVSLPDAVWAQGLPDSLRLTGRPAPLDSLRLREIWPLNANPRPVWDALTAVWSEGSTDSLHLMFFHIDSDWAVVLAPGDSSLDGAIRWSFYHGESTTKTSRVTARWVQCPPGA